MKAVEIILKLFTGNLYNPDYALPKYFKDNYKNIDRRLKSFVLIVGLIFALGFAALGAEPLGYWVFIPSFIIIIVIIIIFIIGKEYFEDD